MPDAMRIYGRLLLILTLTLGSVAARAQTVEEFYKGRQVTLLVISANGGNGLWARAFIPYLSRHLPGHPAIVMQEMPAAAGLVLLNHLYSNAPRDGSMFGAFDRLALLQPLLGTAGAKFDPSKMTALGSLGRQLVTCNMGEHSHVKSISDAMKTEALVGAHAVNDAFYTYANMLNVILHTKFEIIPGYGSTQNMWLAVERREIDGVCGAWGTVKSDRPDWIRDHRVKPIVQASFTGLPELAGVPTLADFSISKTDHEMLDFYANPDVIGRPWVAPPDVPKDRTDALRRAFDAAAHDPGFLADAKRINADVDPTSGEEMQRILQSIYATSPEVLRRVIALREAAENRK